MCGYGRIIRHMTFNLKDIDWKAWRMAEAISFILSNMTDVSEEGFGALFCGWKLKVGFKGQSEQTR